MNGGDNRHSQRKLPEIKERIRAFRKKLIKDGPALLENPDQVYH